MEKFGRILMVEDDPRDVELTLTALEDYKLANEVVVCRDGQEALDYLYSRGKFSDRVNENPAVMLLDLKLPKVDGLEVLQQIKSDERLRMIPVVVLTSSHEEKDMMRSYKLGVNAYVVKPVDFHEFVNAVKELGVFWAVINQPPPRQRKEGIVTSPLRILLLEDDPTDAALIQELLEADNIACEVTRVQTRAEFLSGLEDSAIDLILADYKLPSFDGLSALKLAQNVRPGLPFIFVSGTLGEEVAIEALKIGATDYVLKSRAIEARAVGKAGAARGRRQGSTQAGRGGAAAERDVSRRGAGIESHRQLRLGDFKRRNLLVRRNLSNIRDRADDKAHGADGARPNPSGRPAVSAAGHRAGRTRKAQL